MCHNREMFENYYLERQIYGAISVTATGGKALLFYLQIHTCLSSGHIVLIHDLK